MGDYQNRNTREQGQWKLFRNKKYVSCRYIQFCMDNGSYQGCAFEMPEIEDDSLASQMARLGLDEDNAFNVTQDESNPVYEDQEWTPGDF